jgi:hypothetical protein
MFTPPIRAIFLPHYLNAYVENRKPEIITYSFRSVNNAKPESPLTLLVARILADHAHHAFAADDLAIAANLFY